MKEAEFQSSKFTCFFLACMFMFQVQSVARQRKNKFHLHQIVWIWPYDDSIPNIFLKGYFHPVYILSTEDCLIKYLCYTTQLQKRQQVCQTTMWKYTMHQVTKDERRNSVSHSESQSPHLFYIWLQQSFPGSFKPRIRKQISSNIYLKTFDSIKTKLDLLKARMHEMSSLFWTLGNSSPTVSRCQIQVLSWFDVFKRERPLKQTSGQITELWFLIRGPLRWCNQILVIQLCSEVKKDQCSFFLSCHH